MSGYLFKRSHSNTFKKWNRRWFTLINSRLFYQRKNDYNEVCQIEPDLRVCKIREVNDAERRYTFEIVSPKCKHLLQADSQRECAEWVRCIDYAINYALHNTYKTNNSTTTTSTSTVSTTNSSSQNGDSTAGDHGGGIMSASLDSNADVLDALEFFNLMSQEAANSSASSVFAAASVSNGATNGTNGAARRKENDFYGGGKTMSHNTNSNKNNNNNNKSLEFARKKSEQSERKSIILNVKGNQNCCDCGAPNPNWVIENSICVK